MLPMHRLQVMMTSQETDNSSTKPRYNIMSRVQVHIIVSCAGVVRRCRQHVRNAIR